MSTTSVGTLQLQLSEFQENFKKVERELSTLLVSMEEPIRYIIASLLAGGHVLLEGLPGLGKTLMVKSIAQVFGLSFKRVQFTPDLMPSDVTGTQVLTEDERGKRQFEFKPGPVFCNLLLADEINRATPKTQSSLLEAMEERQVTVLGETHSLPRPFFVLATQNPVEFEGTYPLPEAQLDRFLVKLLIPSPSSGALKEILKRTTGTVVPEVHSLWSAQEASQKIYQMKALVREVFVAEPMYEVLLRFIEALTPNSQYATKKVSQYVRFGPGPRGAQATLLLAKVLALLDGRINLSVEDLRAALLPTLRHRLLVNFQAEADGVNTDDILREVSKAK